MTNKDYAVFRDANRHTCIRVAIDRKYTRFIPMSVVELKVETLGHEAFAKTYEEMTDYSPQRAAQLYLHGDVAVQITPEARKHLELMAGPKFQRPDLSNDPAPDIPPSTEKEDHTMAKKTAAAAETEVSTPAKRKPALKEASAPAAKNAAKKTSASAKKAAPVETEGGRRGRQPNIAGTAKIKVLVKENPKRAKAAERFDLYKNGMTVDEYIAAGGTRADINWDVKQQFIEVK